MPMPLIETKAATAAKSVFISFRLIQRQIPPGVEGPATI
jgi:hypothetical protein